MTLTPVEKEILVAENSVRLFLNAKLTESLNIDDLKLKTRSLEKRVFDLEHSLSWKLTTPLRTISRKLNAFKRKLKSETVEARETLLVTVILTTYNQPKIQIERCVKSVLDQTFTKFRLIVWDDGSTSTETLEFLHSFNSDLDPRVEMIFRENRGVISARNGAAGMCRSKYIAFLDPDDYLEITYLEKLLIFAESHANPGLSVVNSDVAVHGHPEIDIWETGELTWPEIASYNQLPICSLINLRKFNDIGGYSKAMKNGFEDWELWARLASNGNRSRKVAEPLFHYSFQQSAGRDAAAKLEYAKLQTRVKVLNPKKISSDVVVGDFILTPPQLLDHTLVLPANEKPTVFIFVPWLPKAGGAETFLKTLAQGFRDNGRTVCFVSTLQEHPSPSTSEFLNVTPYVYDLPKFLPPKSFVSFVNNLISRVPNAVVLNSGSAWLYENLKRVESVVSGKVRCYDILYNPVGHLPNFLLNQNFFSGVVPVYENLGQVLENYFKVKPTVKTIPVGIDELPLPTTPSGSKNHVGWLGRLSPEKRPEWFMRAGLSIDSNSTFSLAGDGPMREELYDQLPKEFFGLENFKLLGHVDSGTDYVASLDLLVNTSKIEGISVTAMEAISQGVPVLAPRVGGMSDLIIDGVNGYLFDPDDFQDLLSKLNELLSTPNMLSDLRESTRSVRLPSRFKSMEMVKSFEDLFSTRR